MGFADIFRINKIKQQNTELQAEVNRLNAKLNELGCRDYDEVQKKVKEKENYINNLQSDIQKMLHTEERLRQEQDEMMQQIQNLIDTADKTRERGEKEASKLRKTKELYKAICNCIDNFTNLEISPTNCRIPSYDEEEAETIAPTVILKLHSMDVKDLRKAYRENERMIDKVLKQYSTRYTTKTNQAIYKLMVMALCAELQNVLISLKYEKLDTAVESIKRITEKYLQIASEGNQSITGTMTKFIGEIEYLFVNAVKIEYNYYAQIASASWTPA